MDEGFPGCVGMHPVIQHFVEWLEQIPVGFC
jgi:hypothetical protein